MCFFDRGVIKIKNRNVRIEYRKNLCLKALILKGF